jgi:anti-sigma B factor antagonist
MDDRRSRNGPPRLRPRTRQGTLAEIAITRDDRGSYSVLTVIGEVDVTTGSALRDALHELVEDGIHHHIADLRGVRFLDSTGLGILVGHQKRLGSGGSLQVICGSGLVGGVFRLTGVDQLIPVRSTLAAATAAIGEPGGSPPAA